MELEQSVLFLIKGDRLSRSMHQKVAHLPVAIVWLSQREALAQRKPMPLLVTPRRSYGPDLIGDYIRQASLA